MNNPSTVAVNAAALRQVLSALIGPSHLIRELQVTRGMPQLTDAENLNPIDQLIREFNAAVAAQAQGGAT